jgi:hypothetical protein
MADRPIFFFAPMVRTLLDGRKAQTRRPTLAASYHVRPRVDHANARFVPTVFRMQALARAMAPVARWMRGNGRD